MSCKSELWISDDFGDNTATIICRLDEGHSGPHKEEWGKDNVGACNVVVTWEGDDKIFYGAKEST